jgi:predicted lipoprotein with Yx(FWY)xxD motif
VTKGFIIFRSPLRSLLAMASAASLIAAFGFSTASATASTGPKAEAASAATLTVIKVAGYGDVLANSKKKAVYIFSGDPKGGSKCTASCAKTWVPVTATGKTKAGAGVKGSMIKTFKRKSPTGTQVSYNGYALYTYPASPLQGSGAGQAAVGGVFYLIGANGQPIKKTKGGGY